MTDAEYARSLSFLLSQVGAHAAERFAELLGGAGLTPRGFAVMSNLAGIGPRTQQQLADELGMHRNNMVGLIDDLEAAGWVRRRTTPEDRRVHLIELTPAGRRATAKALRVVPVLDAELAADLSAGDARRLVDDLVAIATTAALRPGVHPHLSRRRTRSDARRTAAPGTAH